MWLQTLSARISSRCHDGWGGRAYTLTLGKLVKGAAGVCMGVAIASALLLPRASLAGEPPRQAVRVSTWLDRGACVATPQALLLSPDIALGLVAFNSPYLFGGRALRSQLTCGACHALEGPSGAAVRLRLRAPVPDLRAAAGRIDVAAFIEHAVVAEFDGPALPRRTARALAALAGVLAPRSSDPAEMCRVDAGSLVAIGLRLAIACVDAADAGADELEFLLDSLRFILGEMARGAPPDALASLIAQTNRALHDVVPTVDGASGGVTLATLMRLAQRWEASSDQPRFVLASSEVSADE
ncbi:MAG: hypothetical protein WCN21_14075 [Comamonadaceae bacterium]